MTPSRATIKRPLFVCLLATAVTFFAYLPDVQAFDSDYASVFGGDYTHAPNIKQAYGHTWIVLKALQYLTARNLLPQELQNPDAPRNLLFGASFADNPYMGRPDQYPKYVYTTPDDELWAQGMNCNVYVPGGGCHETFCWPANDALNIKAGCNWCCPGIWGPPDYCNRQASYDTTCDVTPVIYDLQLWLRMVEYSADRPTTAHETSIVGYADSLLGGKSYGYDYSTDNLFHYAEGDLPPVTSPLANPYIIPDVRLFPAYSDDFDMGPWLDLAGVNTCAADLMGNQRIVVGVAFGVATYGSILYQLSRRFFDNDTYWPQPDISELIKAGSGSSIPSQWQNGRMDFTNKWPYVSTNFPYTYLGGNPFVCTGGGKLDPCATGKPVWPAFVPTSVPTSQTRDLYTAQYPGRSNMAAQVYLGWAAHMIEDANVPHHAANWAGNEHAAQEEAANLLANNGTGEVLYVDSSGNYYLDAGCSASDCGYRYVPPREQLTFDQTNEMTTALANRFDSFPDKSAMCDSAGITDSSLLLSGINWPSSRGVFLDALNRGRARAETQDYAGEVGHVFDRLTTIIPCLADAIVDTMKLFYCAAPRTRNGAAPECTAAGSNCYPLLGDAWNEGTIAATGQRYPMDFNVFAFEHVSNLSDVDGPVAAGASVTLASFNLNSAEKEPVGLFSLGAPTLSNGTIYGALYTEDAGYKAPTGVTLAGDGQVVGVSASAPIIDFESARYRLQAASTTLNSQPSNGTTNVEYGNQVTFLSNDAHLNIFTITSDILGNARTISFEVPASSTVVVNVIEITGFPATIQNAGFALNGLSNSQILWNFPNTDQMTMTSAGLPGSILAPYANVTLQWGSVNGTLVAVAVNATGEFHWAPFHNNWLAPP
jgi:choice-of-anchor A domain-containing protein